MCLGLSDLDLCHLLFTLIQSCWSDDSLQADSTEACLTMGDQLSAPKGLPIIQLINLTRQPPLGRGTLPFREPYGTKHHGSRLKPEGGYQPINPVTLPFVNA